MNRTQKNRAGPVIVIGIFLLAGLGTGLTWFWYAGEHPSAVRAHLINDRSAVAEFAPADVPRIRAGTKAIISVNGVRSTGYVGQVVSENANTVFHLVLLEPFAGAAAETPCQVSVDLSVPPELLKDPMPTPR